MPIKREDRPKYSMILILLYGPILALSKPISGILETAA